MLAAFSAPRDYFFPSAMIWAATGAALRQSTLRPPVVSGSALSFDVHPASENCVRLGVSRKCETGAQKPQTQSCCDSL